MRPGLRRLICEGVQAEDYNRPLAGFRIVVDAGNGAAASTPGTCWTPGADVSGSQFLEPDGRFPNHIPNPENPEAMGLRLRGHPEGGRGSGRHFRHRCGSGGLRGRRRAGN